MSSILLRSNRLKASIRKRKLKMVRIMPTSSSYAPILKKFPINLLQHGVSLGSDFLYAYKTSLNKDKVIIVYITDLLKY